MNPYKEALSSRIQTLTELIDKKEAALASAPQGTLRISGNDSYSQYYIRYKGDDKNGTYLSVKEKNLACALAQKDYDRKILQSAQRELRLLLRLQKIQQGCIEEIYPKMCSSRQQLIQPVELPDQEFVQQWKSQSYIKKPFAENMQEHYTRQGERVRSKSEVLIADTLSEMEIPYLYEKPLNLGGRIIHPDFTILQIKTRRTLFLEHFGMMDLRDYAEAAVSRIHLYTRFHIIPGDRLLFTFESRENPVNRRILQTQLQLLL